LYIIRTPLQIVWPQSMSILATNRCLFSGRKLVHVTGNHHLTTCALKAAACEMHQ